MENLVPAIARRYEALPHVDDDAVGRLLVQAAFDQEALEQTQQRLETVELGDFLLPILHLHGEVVSGSLEMILRRFQASLKHSTRFWIN